jgi:hypothetical protein
MATVSRILALPSATDYYPNPPSITSLQYSPNDFGSSTAGTFFRYEIPSVEWKNKSSALYKYRVVWKNAGNDTFPVIADTLLNESVAFSSTLIGVEHTVYPYTRSNGRDKDGTGVKFYPQTKPNQSPAITGSYISNSLIIVSWQAIDTVSPNYYTNWGGAPENLGTYPNSDRQYEINITNFSTGQTTTSTVSYLQTEFQFGGSFSGQYRVVVYAKNKAGYSTFIPASAVNLYATPIPPYFPPYFGPPLIY